MTTRIYVRRGTDAERQTVVLENGEPAWTTDNNQFYVGDGTTSGGVFIGGLGAGVNSINSLYNAVTISGLGGISISEDGQIIVISGKDEFLELLDTPSEYSGDASKIVVVNATEDGLEFSSEFVSSVNSLNGAVTISGGTGITISEDGQVITIARETSDEWSLTPNPSEGEYSGHSFESTAGENLTFGDVVVYNSDGKWWLTDASAESTAKGFAGLAVEVISADATGNILCFGFATYSGWAWTTGDVLYLSTTSGTLTSTVPSASGEVVRVMGFAYDANTVYFNPSPDWFVI